MIARIVNDLCKLGDKYRLEYDRADDPREAELISAKRDVIREMDDLIQKAWDEGESMRTELFEVQPKTIEDVLILGITGLRVFLDPADGQIFYELENRHIDTEKEVLMRAIEGYNRSVRGIEYNQITGTAIDVTDTASLREWKRKCDGSYEKKPLPKVRRV